MIRISRLLVLLAIAVSLPSLLSAGEATRNCTISGDIQSEPVEVVVGVAAPNTFTLVGKNGESACLHFSNTSLLEGLGIGDSLLAEEMKSSGAYGQLIMVAGPAWHMGRFDFSFGPDPGGCITPIYTSAAYGGTSDELPHWIDGDQLCPYRLRILNGSYDKNNDRVTFDMGSTVELMDATMGESEINPDKVVGYCADIPEGEPKIKCLGECKDDPGLCPDCNCIDDYRVDTGPAGNIVVQFLSDSGGGGKPTNEPEKGNKRCSDGVDNDGDGYIDGADPDC